MPLNKLFDFVKKNFLTKKFLTFGFIGVLNTVISLSVYYVFYRSFQLGAGLSNTIGFIVASVFSYFANAFFTFKPKNKSTTQFSIVMIVFVVRLLISDLLTILFNYIMLQGFHADYDAHKYLTIVAPFFASALLIPIAYFALDLVFKKTDVQNSKNA